MGGRAMKSSKLCLKCRYYNGDMICTAGRVPVVIGYYGACDRYKKRLPFKMYDNVKQWFGGD